LINKSRVKENVELNVAEEVYLALDEEIKNLLKKAEERAKKNQRRTIQARDL
jgi:histone H3/H4